MADAQSIRRRSDFKDLTGMTFGRWTVLNLAATNTRQAYWHCRCSCGVERECRGDQLKAGTSVSCGCYMVECRTTHGKSLTPTYYTWKSVLARCTNPKSTFFHRYGGRGITVCERWMKFDNFIADMGERPAGKNLDRENNNGNYEPGNCRWATQKQQCLNKCNNRIIEIDGVSKSVPEWCKHFGVALTTAYSRLYLLKWDEVLAVSTPSTIVRHRHSAP